MGLSAKSVSTMMAVKPDRRRRACSMAQKLLRFSRMSGSAPNRHELEVIWRERLKVARSKYDSAVAEFRRVSAEQKQWPLPAPDGSAAFRNARSAESAALNEYMRTLKIFTDLIVSGKMPGSD